MLSQSKQYGTDEDADRRLYVDVSRFASRSQVGNTPTLANPKAMTTCHVLSSLFSGLIRAWFIT